MHKFYLQKHFIRFEIFFFCWNIYSKTARGTSYFVLLIRDSSDGKIKENEMDGACGTYGREKCIPGFGEDA
jgi:hypothetical protein